MTVSPWRSSTGLGTSPSYSALRFPLYFSSPMGLCVGCEEGGAVEVEGEEEEVEKADG
jgi:hypothetical protein